VLDFVGDQDTPELGLRVLRRGGTYSVVGYGGRLALPTVEMITQEYHLLGNFVGTYRDLLELMELERERKVTVAVQKYPLEKAAEAVSDLREGRVRGRAVLVP
jgi:NAD+-dependent secondary alcohol dehydrogenase Adh1